MRRLQNRSLLEVNEDFGDKHNNKRAFLVNLSFTENDSRNMIVCIAEKPSVAKEIADILGARSRHDGYYEGNGYQVTWTFGHLCTLKEPHD